MGLFDEALEGVKGFVSEKASKDAIRILNPGQSVIWPAGSGLVLEEETAVELGNPKNGSFFMVMWTDLLESIYRIILIGPDIKEVKSKSIPFALILIVKGSPDDIYRGWYELKEAIYTIKPDGFMMRMLPSRHIMWCKVSKEALENGFSFLHLGCILMENIRKLNFVSGADLLFVTSGKEDVERLKTICGKAIRAVEAMLKMNVEMALNCDSCEYRDVCESVEELRKLRNKLVEALR